MLFIRRVIINWLFTLLYGHVKMYLCLKFFSVPLLYSFIVQSRIARKIKRFVTRTLVYFIAFLKQRTLPQYFSSFDKDQIANIHWYCSKEVLKICKLAKFKSDTLKASGDIAPQSRKAKIYRRLYGGWHKTCAHHTLYKRKIQCFCRAMSLLLFNKSRSNLASLLILQCSSEVLSLVRAISISNAFNYR